MITSTQEDRKMYLSNEGLVSTKVLATCIKLVTHIPS